MLTYPAATPLADEYLGAVPEYRGNGAQATLRRKRTKGLCRCCLRMGCIERHHIIPRRCNLSSDGEWNLIDVCWECHREIHARTAHP